MSSSMSSPDVWQSRGSRASRSTRAWAEPHTRTARPREPLEACRKLAPCQRWRLRCPLLRALCWPRRPLARAPFRESRAVPTSRTPCSSDRRGRLGRAHTWRQLSEALEPYATGACEARRARRNVRR
eukprot:2997566-Prymnesium_polylepis.4